MMWQLAIPVVAVLAVAFVITTLVGRALGTERLRRLRPWIRLAGFVPLFVTGLVSLVSR